ncbi:MAG TPA: type I glutamate--ammonia ligase [Candidatus Bathyarchaeia archaeon]|nr:type I glutamate--ammonia ligase [Candidatus Bathyarchaeia archaeon]
MNGQDFKARENMAVCLSLIKHADHIMLHFVDLLGALKGRTVPAQEAESVLRDGVGFDGSSIPGYLSIHESDMVMKPDISTFAVLPRYFYDKAVVSFLCDTYLPDGRRFEGDSRYICSKKAEEARSHGYEPTAAAELEFYLVEKDTSRELRPVEHRVKENPRYFDIAPNRDITEPYRMDLSDTLSSMGIVVERQHHEVGSAQNEITFQYSNPITTADNITRYKLAAKAVADRKYNWTATFMPKPLFGKAGNGMHVHLGLFSTKTGKNLFYDPEGYACLSQACRYFIGGVLEHARALSAIAAPTVNSYKRLVPGYEAPVYLAWSRKNRSALVRVPEYFPGKENEARIEYRSPDPLCNPYLAYTVLFEAGLEGIKKKTEPGDPVDENVYHLTESRRKQLGIKTLPATLKEALDEWNNDDICIRALGRENAEKYRRLKMEEWREYQLAAKPATTSKVTKWEVQKYLLA